MVVEDFNGVKHLYHNETWSQKHFNYSPKPMDFLVEGEPLNTSIMYQVLCIYFNYFGLMLCSTKLLMRPTGIPCNL